MVQFRRATKGTGDCPFLKIGEHVEFSAATLNPVPERVTTVPLPPLPGLIVNLVFTTKVVLVKSPRVPFAKMKRVPPKAFANVKVHVPIVPAVTGQVLVELGGLQMSRYLPPAGVRLVTFSVTVVSRELHPEPVTVMSVPAVAGLGESVSVGATPFGKVFQAWSRVDLPWTVTMYPPSGAEAFTQNEPNTVPSGLRVQVLLCTAVV